MCLYFEPDKQKKLINKLFGRKKSVEVYKLLAIEFYDNDDKLVTPFQGKVVKTVDGFLISNRNSQQLTEKNKKQTVMAFQRLIREFMFI